MLQGLLRRKSLGSSHRVHRSGCDADCPQPVLAENDCSHSTSVGPACVQALIEESARIARILSRPGRLELTPELQQEPSELRPSAQLEVPEGTAASLPEWAQIARARLNLAKAFLHPARTHLHAASVTTKSRAAIGTLTDVSQ
jgi:hypothetical protein